MFKNIRKNWRRKLLGGLSLTSALFIFQACYGTPQDMGLDIMIEGKVLSQKTRMPIKGIRVSVEDKLQYEFTDIDGKFSFYTETAGNYKIKFEDTDSGENGNYIGKDTVLTSIDKRVYLNIALQDK
jgi:putative lipoprotein (rSAM/lipoprotein system)